ncbi:MAG: UDP-N-acetylmuramoyl-L-alanyl-D-glutamate--2,6-diaminopimelate ligase [Clostridiales bacterium]|nr:UDP-N-acetylmuramoyl-L-alanyl-D-glutamate--2,6-diaminopimelate ligase [Clostridiales bacterium]
MTLRELAAGLPFPYEIAGDENTEINDICTDTRRLKKGGLYVCIRGLKTDSHLLAPQAEQLGASALVTEKRLDTALPQLLVSSTREALSFLAARFYGNPAEALKLIGITGTKGKTTTSFLLKSILEAAGHKTGLIGTVCVLIGDREYEAGLTTPDPIEFQKILYRMKEAGIEYVIMEVSAHALDMHRIDGTRFEAAAFTNLSQDHLDYFGTMENYLEAKLKIIPMAARLVVNVDDATVRQAVDARGAEYTPVGIREKANVYANRIDVMETGVRFLLTFHKRFREEINLRLSGIFNVYNALTAAALADECGVAPEHIKAGLEAISNVPGRVELLDTHTPYRVILDYAHSPDALENVLRSLRQSTRRRLIAVFGCGGGRDKTKRPIMGEIGGRLADLSIITSDNPRDEEPMEIIREIEAGIKGVTEAYEVIENRRDAIKRALSIAQSGDTVVLAGKGHETYQEIRGVKHPFDEKEIVRELLKEI